MREFFQDNHFADKTGFHQVPDELNPLIENAKELYPMAANDQKKASIIGKVNINSLNFRIGDIYIKVLEHSEEGQRRVSCYPAIVNTLKKFEIPVNGFLQSRNGFYIEKIYHQGRSYLMYGQEFQKDGFFTGSLGEYKNAIQVVNSLKDTSLSLSKIISNNGQYQIAHIFDHLPAIFSKIEIKTTKDNFDLLLLNNKDVIFNSLRQAENIYADLSRVSVYHCDLHPHNILTDRSKITAILDLESFVYMPQEVFYGFTLFKLGRKVLGKDASLLSQIKRLIGQQDHFERLKYYCKAEILRRITSILDLHYNTSDTRWDFDINKQVVGLKECDIIYSEGR